MIHVTGHLGQLGRSLLATDKCIIAGQADLEAGDVVINCAAKTNHNFCNENPDIAWESNVQLVRTLVQDCKDKGATLIHISTDYVFDCQMATENEMPFPVERNAYATTKWIAEEYLKICDFENWVCVRISWLLSPYKKVDWLSMPEVWGQIGSPVWAPNFADALIDLCKDIKTLKKREFYHFTPNQHTSRGEMASYYQQNGVKHVPCPEDRPSCSALYAMKNLKWDPMPLSAWHIVEAYRQVHG